MAPTPADVTSPHSEMRYCESGMNSPTTMMTKARTKPIRKRVTPPTCMVRYQRRAAKLPAHLTRQDSRALVREALQCQRTDRHGKRDVAEISNFRVLLAAPEPRHGGEEPSYTASHDPALWRQDIVGVKHPLSPQQDIRCQHKAQQKPSDRADGMVPRFGDLNASTASSVPWCDSGVKVARRWRRERTQGALH